MGVNERIVPMIHITSLFAFKYYHLQISLYYDTEQYIIFNISVDVIRVYQICILGVTGIN